MSEKQFMSIVQIWFRCKWKIKLLFLLKNEAKCTFLEGRHKIVRFYCIDFVTNISEQRKEKV